ncbi:hypothetical protein HD806DRAFT_508013 [Xylariaceae sp. AK1471]|nr:hypothetical protein HD806DRAFT_508013 [Xylariaceae sp. AK1471]
MSLCAIAHIRNSSSVWAFVLPVLESPAVTTVTPSLRSGPHAWNCISKSAMKWKDFGAFAICRSGNPELYTCYQPSICGTLL